MVKTTEKILSLEVLLAEQRRDYDYLLHIYNRLRAMEQVLLTACFGVIAYLYYTAPTSIKPSIAHRLFIPSEDYGKVIYLIAASFFLLATMKLIFNVFGNNPWETAHESAKSDYTYAQIDTLMYIQSRYKVCHKHNASQYEKRRREMVVLFYSILISATILVVIKTLR